MSEWDARGSSRGPIITIRVCEGVRVWGRVEELLGLG